jgi:LysM repeat protein
MGLTKVKIVVEHTGAELNAMFNPEEYTLNRDNNFAQQAIPGLSSPLLQFAHGNLRTLDMELLFDTYEQRSDVRVATDRLIRLMEIDPELHAPPVLVVAWASLQFRCVLTRASQKFILFREDGRPARARVTVSFAEFIDPEREAKQVKRQSADHTQSHTVLEGETLGLIAFKHYGDAATWRPIALVNGIDDPLVLAPGQPLDIPTLPYIDPVTGEAVN